MDWTLIWSARAQRELRRIHKHIAAENETAADRLVGTILERVEAVRKVPTIGAPFRDLAGHEGRQIVVGSYRIIYAVNESLKRVEVLTVWHGARREPNLG
uniref:Type II toxin-antitoxin system RelE/ParE family toxin n=1 Tax=Schlesneria paludicola TaxID=360056 RepID=A0A7C2P0N3_9PLAN